MAEDDINQALELFKSRNLRKKKWSLDLAVELRTPEAAALIIKAMEDQSWDLREYAIAKAVQMGAMMVPSLCRLLRSGVWYSRAAAIKALDSIGDIRSLPQLRPLVNDSNRTVAQAAKAALNHLVPQAELSSQSEPGENKLSTATFPDDINSTMVSCCPGMSRDEEAQDDPQILQQIRQAIKFCSLKNLESEDVET